MQVATVEYKLTNITKWPNVHKGKHKKGFIISIGRKSLHVGHHMFVKDLTEGIEALQKRKYLKIETVQNRQVLVREQIEETDKAHEKDLELQKKQQLADEKKLAEQSRLQKEQELENAKNASKNSEPANSLDKDALKEAVKNGQPENRTIVSEGEGEDPTGDLEEPVYANGQPNFVVKAPSQQQKQGQQHKQGQNNSRR